MLHGEENVKVKELEESGGRLNSII